MGWISERLSDHLTYLNQPLFLKNKQKIKKIKRGHSNKLLYSEGYQQWENETALFAAVLHSRNREGHVQQFHGGWDEEKRQSLYQSFFGISLPEGCKTCQF